MNPSIHRAVAFLLGNCLCLRWIWGVVAGAGLLIATSPPADSAAPPDRSLAAERPLPRQAVKRLGSTRFRHPDKIYSMSWSHDGAKLATGDGDGTTRVWDAHSGALLSVPVKGVHGRHVQFAPTGQVLYTTGYTGFLQQIDLLTDTRIKRRCYIGIKEIAVSPKMDYIAVVGGDKGELLVLDAKSLKTQFVLPNSRFGPGAMSFSTSGRILAASSYGPGRLLEWRILLWSMVDGKEIGSLDGHTDRIFFLAFSPTTNLLLSGSMDGTTRVWDVKKKLEVRKLPVRCDTGEFSPNGKLIVTCNLLTSTVRVYDAATWKEVLTIDDCGGEVWGVAFSPDGRKLLTRGRQSLRIWDIKTGKQLLARPGHEATVFSLHYSPDGKTLYSMGGDQVIRRWDVAAGKEVGRLPLNQGARYLSSSPPTFTTAMALSADGTKLASVDGLTDLASRAVLVWDRADDPKSRRQLRASDKVPKGVALSPDGSTAAVTSWSGVRLWNLASGNSIGLLVDPGPAWIAENHPPLIGGDGVAFSSDGRTLAAVERSQLLLWDWRTGAFLRRVPVGRTAELAHATFSPGGHLVAACGSSKVGPSAAAHLWEAETGKPVAALRAVVSSTFCSAFSPDGRLLAVAEYGGTVRIWDVFARTELALLAGHVGHVTSVAFSPDGRTVASGSTDTTILLWDVSKLCSSLPTSATTPKGRAAWWDDLTSGEAAIGYDALIGLAGGGEAAVSYIASHLAPVARLPKGHLDKLIQQLDDDGRTRREAASADLEKLGLLAEPALRRSLAGRVPAETRRRGRNLLVKAETLRGKPEVLRASRAILALELAGSESARKHLARLATGDPDAEVTRAASSALARLRLAR